MENIHEKRLQRLRVAMGALDIDTLMVQVDENRRYLSGFTAEDTQFDESAGVLFITDEKQVLATDSRYELQARNEAPLFEVYRYKEGHIKALADILNGLKTKRLGFEGVRLSFRHYQDLLDRIDSWKLDVKPVETRDLVEKLRLHKEESEIAAISTALKITETIFVELCDRIKPGMTEKKVAWRLEMGLRQAGAEGLSFPCIVASGPNSALPHAIPGERPIEKGEPILFDWGIRLSGYCSDISRTVIFGKPDKRFQTVYDTVYEAQQKAIAALKPGIKAKEIDAIARDHIDAAGFADKFGHGLGHGVGLAIHEAPRLGPTKDVPLEPGMVFTVEPGIYIPGWGGVRIENMVAMGDDGPRVLNRLDTDMLVLSECRTCELRFKWPD